MLQLKQLHFYFFVCVEGSPPIFYVPTFPWKYFFSMNEKEAKERELYFTQGEVPVLLCSPEVQEHPWVPLPQEKAVE